MKNLKFDRPIAFIDVETTGLNVSSDRIVELTILKIHPDGTEELKSHRINPGIPIPAETTDIHGITDEDVADEPQFQQYASSICAFLDGCDIGGFGVRRFDLPILEAEFRRVDVSFSRRGRRIIDTQIIYHKLHPRDLDAAYKEYCGKELENAHTSGGDARASAEVLESQLCIHPELPQDVDGLHDFCNGEEANWVDAEGKFAWSEGEAVFTFGKYKGQSLKSVASMDEEYIEWIASADFSLEVKEIAINALNGDFPEPPEPLQPTEGGT